MKTMAGTITVLLALAGAPAVAQTAAPEALNKPIDPYELRRIFTEAIREWEMNKGWDERSHGDPWTDDELRQIREPIDFLGVNYYLKLAVCDDPAAGPARSRVVMRPNCPRTATDWPRHPRLPGFSSDPKPRSAPVA